jgi:hypothetical protein
VAKHGEDVIALIGGLKVAGSVELVHEAEAIGMTASQRWLDEALEDIFDPVGLDIEVFA